MKTRQLPFLLLATCLGFPPSAFPQQETATITGFVRDQSGAIVPNAKVMVTNAHTNITLTAETNAQGAYVIASLRPGEYVVIVERSGFSSKPVSGITLKVAQVASVDLTIAAGGVTETVEVSAHTPLLDSQTSSRGLVIDQRNIAELPLNGRDYNQLARLSPGVLPPTPRLSSVMKGAFNVNGNRAFSNGFQLDGVDNMSYSSSFRGENDVHRGLRYRRPPYLDAAVPDAALLEPAGDAELEPRAAVHQGCQPTRFRSPAISKCPSCLR